MHDAADVRHVPVHVGVCRGVAGRRALAAGCVRYDLAIEVAHDHRLGVELVVGHAGRLDDEEVGARYSAGHVPAGPHDEPVAHQLSVERGDLVADDGDVGVGAGRGHEAPCEDASAARRSERSRFMTEFPPRPNQSWSCRYSS